MSEEFSLWNPGQSDAGGLSKDQILQWESEHGVQLPKLLRRAYREHDGGVVRATSIHLNRLSDFAVPDDDMWEDMADEDEDGFEDRSRIWIIGEDLNVGGNYLLNYNLCHDDGDPSIWSYFFDGTGASKLSRSASRFLKKQASIAEAPEVSWQESDSLPILADESIDESSWLPPGTISRYRLVQGDGKLILFRQGLDLESASGGQRLTRTELPLPLNADSIELRRRRPGGPWGLHLEPQDSEEIICLESVELPGSGWKNRTSRGVPIYETIECDSKERLEQLRVRLIGEAAAGEAAAEDDRMTALQARMESSSPEEMKLMNLQMLHAMQLDLPDLMPPGELPPELAAATAHIQGLQKKMMEELEKTVGNLEVPPEVQAMIDGMRKKLNRPGKS